MFIKRDLFRANKAMLAQRIQSKNNTKYTIQKVYKTRPN